MMRSLAPEIVVLAVTLFLAPLAAVAVEEADLSMSHTVSPNPATATATLTYSMNIFNNGPAIVATGVTVTDTLPAGLTFVSATFTLRGGGSTPCTGTTTITCTIGNLTLGGGAAVVIVVTPQGPGILSNTATVSANESDPEPQNNTATAVTPVVPPTSSPSLVDANLSLSTVASGLVEPTGLAFLGPQDLLVTEKSTGRVQRIVNGVLVGPVLTLPVNFASERGLLGIALHPRFANNGFVYLFWTCRGPAAGAECEDGPPSNDIARVPLLGNRVDRFVWDGAMLTFNHNVLMLRAFQADVDQNGIFNQPLRGNHDGGKIAFGPDGKLYTLIGDNGRRGWMQNVLPRDPPAWPRRPVWGAAARQRALDWGDPAPQ